MAAPKGNQFWKARAKHGRDKLFSDPLALWEDCQGYFEWVESNPLYEAKAFAFQGAVTVERLPKMRAMTITGLCLYLGIDRSTWADYGRQKDFSDITTRVEAAIFSQKFEGASADLLNANIIARELGLAEKREVTGEDGGPIQHEVDAAEELTSLLDRLAQSGS